MIFCWVKWNKKFYSFSVIKLYLIKQYDIKSKFESYKNGHNKGVIFYSTAICNPNLFYLTAMNYDLWMKQKNFLCIPFVEEKYIKLYSWSATFSVTTKVEYENCFQTHGKDLKHMKKALGSLSLSLSYCFHMLSIKLPHISAFLLSLPDHFS